MVAPLYKNVDTAMEENEEELHNMKDMDMDDNKQTWEDWDADEDDEEHDDVQLLCLFCDSKFSSSDSLFEHCSLTHSFDFKSIRTTMNLDFYGCFKLLNYIRSQVGQNRCWSLQDHLHEPSLGSSNLPWENDMYLKPYMEEDHLLYSFDENEEIDDDPMKSVDEDMMENLKISIEEDEASSSVKSNGTERDDKKSTNAIDCEIVIVNKNYFGSYGSFGIHKEMISDKVRTDAYRKAIVENPSLIKGAVVLDVGCGTGILSLFAAQAGASMVNAVEASDKMASVASQIAKDNGLFWNQTSNQNGAIKVVNKMVEDLIESKQIEPKSVDVLISEWMGYCLLYESMLTSVLIARDHWLKPGGAMLPDTATMFVAGFGKGATSMPFWENVYGFDMSSIGKELVEDASHIPIVDVVDGNNLVTNTSVLKTFDLMTMKHEEVDFTASVQLQQKSLESQSTITKCYGIVLWFDTSFTNRFCKEAPTVLSTSPYTPSTHWSQTLLTFREPISLASKSLGHHSSSRVGTDVAPAVDINSRVSIVRGVEHRSIDISLEVTAVGFDGRKRKWPVQMFNMR